MLACVYVCMLICHYTHPLLANMLAVIKQLQIYLLTCLLFLSDCCSFIVEMRI